MTEGAIRQRSRIAPAATRNAAQTTALSTQPQGDGDASWMHQGDDGDAMEAAEKARRQQEAEERLRRGYVPIRFNLKVGEAADIIILDNDLGPRLYEHERYRASAPPGKKFTFECCPGEWDNCPLCDGVGDFNARTFVMFLTILDLRPYTYPADHRYKPGLTVPVTKKLLPVKLEQIGFYRRLIERHGSLRGVHLLMTREVSTHPKIGNGEYQDKYDDQTLLDNYSHPEEKDAQNNVIREANEVLRACNYGLIFPKPTGADLRMRYAGGAGAPAGSSQDNAWQNEGGQSQAGAQTSGRAGGIRPRAQAGGAQANTGGQSQGGAGAASDDPDDIPL